MGCRLIILSTSHSSFPNFHYRLIPRRKSDRMWALEPERRSERESGLRCVFDLISLTICMASLDLLISLWVTQHEKVSITLFHFRSRSFWPTWPWRRTRVWCTLLSGGGPWWADGPVSKAFPSPPTPTFPSPRWTTNRSSSPMVSFWILSFDSLLVYLPNLCTLY